MANWLKGEQTVIYLIDRGRLESFEASDLTALAVAQIHRASLRLNATSISALENGDVDGCYAAAYDPYRMAAEALLARQGLRATQVAMARICLSKMLCLPSSPPRFRH